jgi:uncharacterized RDD family membrane protein YckC
MITPLTEYASFKRRFAATIIDILWISLWISWCSYLIAGEDWISRSNEVSLISLEQFAWQAFLLNEILPALLTLWFWIKYAATPGKLLFDCEIVDADTGNPINAKQAFLRYLGYFFSTFALGLGFLWIIWDKRKQGWHDKMAHTVVIIHDEAAVPLHQLEKQALG